MSGGSGKPFAEFSTTAPFEAREDPIDDRLAWLSHPGRRHAENQDSASAYRFGNMVLMAVADGVSTSNTPRAAAQAATDAWMDKTLRLLASGFSMEDAMDQGFEHANEAVLSLPWDTGSGRPDPQTTLVAAIICQGEARVGWAGDSRAYAIDPDSERARQLTADDSWMAKAISAGVPHAVASLDRKAHAITQCLGARAKPPKPHALTFEIAPGAMLLLCTDGLWNPMADPLSLCSAIGRKPADAQSVCHSLVREANRLGGRDNITVAVSLP